MAENKTPLHEGFYIPNAVDVINSPRMAEPDKIDFNILAHPLWGVIDGCRVSVTSSTATVEAGTVLVNGQIISVARGTTGLGVGGAQDRFDLIVATSSGAVTTVVGTPSLDPVFPDPPLAATVLAAVFCPHGDEENLSENVIDKRKFINKALLTKIAPGEALIRNMNDAGNHFLMSGDGRATWESDTWMWRSAPATLSIHQHLKLEGTLTVGGNIDVAGNIAAIGTVTGSNLHWNTTAPIAPINPGSIWQSPSDGRIFVWQGGKWQEIATTESAMPRGTIITSVELPTVMEPLGWIPLNGNTVNEATQPSLFRISGLNHLHSGTAPNRTMVMPDATHLVLVTDWAKAPGTKVSKNPGNQVTLQTSNMPRHKHGVRTSAAGAASPTVTINRVGGHTHGSGGGLHGHLTEDYGHRHQGMDAGGDTPSWVVGEKWNGMNSIDAVFNDRNHPVRAEPMAWTMSAKANITVRYEESGHGHDIHPAGEHEHTGHVSGIADHNHPLAEDEVGNGVAFDITPEYLTVYSYIRS